MVQIISELNKLLDGEPWLMFISALNDINYVSYNICSNLHNNLVHLLTFQLEHGTETVFEIRSMLYDELSNDVFHTVHG